MKLNWRKQHDNRGTEEEVVKQRREGNPLDRDIILLHYELLESQIEKQYNLNAHDAHDEASKTYDWLGQLHRETSKKGEKGVFLL